MDDPRSSEPGGHERQPDGVLEHHTASKDLFDVVSRCSRSAGSPSLRARLSFACSRLRRTGAGEAAQSLVRPRRLLVLACAALLLGAWTSAAAHGQPGARGGDAADDGPLSFRNGTATPADAGHAMLRWRPHPQAIAYQVHDAEQQVLYRGRFPQAFVSGLPDGEHRFWVTALDARGNPLARGPEPAVVVVRHFSALKAWSLFSIGAVVFASLVAVLVTGVVRTRNDATGAADGGAAT